MATAVNFIGSSSILYTPANSLIFEKILSPSSLKGDFKNLKISKKSRLVTHFLYSLSLPQASSPPITAPIEVPAMLIISKPSFLISSIAPICA